MTDKDKDAYWGRHSKGRKQAASPGQFDAEAEKMLEDIEQETGFPSQEEREALSALEDEEPESVIEPDDISPDGVARDVGAASGALDQSIEGVDELTEDIDLSEVEHELEADLEQQRSAVEDEGPTEEEVELAVRRRRGRLRTVLVLFIVILVVVAVVIGLLVHNGTLSPNLVNSDTEELQSPSAGTGEVEFEPVENSAIPDFVSAYGKTIDEVSELYSGTVVLEEEATPVEEEDERVKAMQEVYEGQLVDESGKELGSVGFGMNKKGKVVYVYCLFDLDALAVADASFEELAGSDVVASSLLEASGVDSSALADATLTSTVAEEPEETDGEAAEEEMDADGEAAEDEEAAEEEAAEDGDDVEEVAFSGTTGLEEPATWELAETYDWSLGEVLGDNSVMRTLLVEFY